MNIGPMPKFLKQRGKRPAGMQRVAVLACLLLLLAVAALVVDVPLSLLCMEGAGGTFRLPGDLRKAVYLSEVFAHGMGVAAILATIYVVDPVSRRRLLRVLACVLLAGAAVNLVKGCVERSRPYAYLNNHGSATIGEAAERASIDTFGRLLPLGDGGHAAQSFPSGHTATALALAVALSWLYPRGRNLFWTFALLAAFQRIASGSHHLSDTLVGATIGIVVASLLTQQTRMAAFFDWHENRSNARVNFTPTLLPLHRQNRTDVAA